MRRLKRSRGGGALSLWAKRFAASFFLPLDEEEFPNIAISFRSGTRAARGPSRCCYGAGTRAWKPFRVACRRPLCVLGIGCWRNFSGKHNAKCQSLIIRYSP